MIPIDYLISWSELIVWRKNNFRIFLYIYKVLDNLYFMILVSSVKLNTSAEVFNNIPKLTLILNLTSSEIYILQYFYFQNIIYILKALLLFRKEPKFIA